MNDDSFTIGIDFGTESGRAVLVRVSDGAEIASAVHRYRNGVIDTALPDGGPELPPEWALQDPDDYLDVLQRTVPAVLRNDEVAPEKVIGIGIDFTSSTILPTDATGTPLCRLPEFRANPHAWVKLWKHHAAQPQANRMDEVARARGETWLECYGGKVSSEWFFSKALQIFEEAPDAYRAADNLIEAGDWIVWQMTGVKTRSACAAGYKAFHQNGRFPDRKFFADLNPGFANVVAQKLSGELLPPGSSAGVLSEEAAGWTGLPAGIPVAVANIDAHVTVPATGYTDPGTLVLIMGTSTCHILIAKEKRAVEGMCGVVAGGVIPDLYGYESGQSAVGDIFGWFVENWVPGRFFVDAQAAGKEIHSYLAELAAKQAPGEHGLLALDWHNGNRSILVNAGLSGLLVGITLRTTAVDVYRALMEATAFGTRLIVESYEKSGLRVERVVAAGGLPEKSPLLMQIYADVLGREIEVIRSSQGAALGSAVHAAVAAGVHPDIAAAARAMGGVSERVYRPGSEASKSYEDIYRDYLEMHDHFGKGRTEEPGGVMSRLRARQSRVRGANETVG